MKNLVLFTMALPSSLRAVLLKNQILVIFNDTNCIGLKLKVKAILLKNSSKIIFLLPKTKKVLKYFKKLHSLMTHTIFYGLLRRYKKKLNLKGIGYRISLTEENNKSILTFKLGYSHLFFFKIPKGLNVLVPKPNKLLIFGSDLEKIFFVTSFIKSLKVPDSYKGKGLFFENDKIVLKKGKKI
jgi:large subunit ribosomal protein L6